MSPLPGLRADVGFPVAFRHWLHHSPHPRLFSENARNG